MRRRRGDLHGARVALRHAEASGLQGEAVLLQECALVKEGGDFSGALALLEPLELDIAGSRRQVRVQNQKQSGGLVILQNQEQEQDRERGKHQLAMRLFLAAKWMSLSHVKHGRAVVDRYKLALDLCWQSSTNRSWCTGGAAIAADRTRH
jgi:hypothetical protein